MSVAVALAAVSAATKIVGSVSGAFGELEAQQQANDNELLKWTLEADERFTDYVQAHNTAMKRIDETNVAARSMKVERLVEAMQEEGRLAVATGEAGISGNTADRLMVENAQALGFDLGAIESERQNRVASAYDNDQVMKARAKPPVLVQQAPDVKQALLKSLLGVAGGVVDGISTYSAVNGGLTKPKPATPTAAAGVTTAPAPAAKAPVLVPTSKPGPAKKAPVTPRKVVVPRAKPPAKPARKNIYASRSNTPGGGR